MNDATTNDCTIFSTLGGSHAYGTNLPTSDVDIRGICLPKDKRLYYGITGNFEQKQNWDTGEDKTIYDLRRACHLMLGANPNMLELLWTDQKFWLNASCAWWDLYQIRNKFLSKRVRNTYGGYAFAQLKHIKNHRSYLLNPPKKRPQREDFGLSEKRHVTNDELHAFLWLITHLLKDSVEMMNLSESTKLEISAANFFGLVQSKIEEADAQDKRPLQALTNMPQGFIDECMREKAYMSAVKQYKAYENWADQRNAKRQALEAEFGYDTKHAMHLVRLMRMAEEILTTGQVHVLRQDAEELLSIRNGAWPYQKIEEYAIDCEARLTKLAEQSSLPQSPDILGVEQVVMKIIEDYVL